MFSEIRSPAFSRFLTSDSLALNIEVVTEFDDGEAPECSLGFPTCITCKYVEGLEADMLPSDALREAEADPTSLLEKATSPTPLLDEAMRIALLHKTFNPRHRVCLAILKDQ